LDIAVQSTFSVDLFVPKSSRLPGTASKGAVFVGAALAANNQLGFLKGMVISNQYLWLILFVPKGTPTREGACRSLLRNGVAPTELLAAKNQPC
jgi:hypothetical protein